MILRLYTFVGLTLFCNFAYSSNKNEEDNSIRKVQIAIVGGGMSGLSTAYYLGDQHKNLDIHVFEAKGNLGGRTCTHYFDSNRTQYFEQGGTTIDVEHTKTIELAKKLNIPLIKVEYGVGKLSVIHEGKEISSQRLIESLEKSKELFCQEAKRINSNPEDEYTWDIQSEECRCKSFSTVFDKLKDPLSKAFWQTLIKDECGIELENAISICTQWLELEASNYERLISSRENRWVPNFLINYLAYEYRVEGGMSRLVEAVASKTSEKNIHLNHALKIIDKQDGQYHLSFEKRQDSGINALEKVIAEKVVLTLPFSTLRDVKITESVGLNPTQFKAINTFSYGTNSKIGFPVDGSFEMLYHINLNEQFISWPGEKAVTIMLGGNSGQELDVSKASTLVDAEKATLKTIYPQIGNFGQPIIKNWADDEFAKGSYSAITTNMDQNLLTPSDNPLFKGMFKFAESTADQGLFFAGEHTRSDEFRSHIEGAVRSGKKVAKAINKSMINLK